MANRKTVLLVIILIIAAFLRFYNLMHDAPYFFNPDERNMASAVTQLRLPQDIKDIPKCIINELSATLSPKPFPLNPNICNLNPHFFAYGQFPLYLAFLSNRMQTTSFLSAIFWLRFWSALASTLTVLFVFLISRQFLSYRFSLLAMLFTVFTPGLIQSAHFGTTESLLTFFFMVSIYLSISYLSNSGRLSNLKFIFLASLTTGLAFGSKLTGLFCLIPVFVSYSIQVVRLMESKISKLKKFISLLDHWSIGIIFVFLTIIFCILFSPYNLIDQKDFLGSVFGYEQDVATGRYEAFYTRQFTGTVPVLFQMQKVFPYALGWPVFILGSMGFLIISFKLINKSLFSPYFLILASSFLFYLLPNAFLFAKWTRFMTPIFPFFAIFSGVIIYSLSKLFSRLKVFIFALCILSLLPGLAFFSIYTRPDSRVQASRWIYDNIPDNSYILSETANVIDIPLGLPNYHPSTGGPIPNYKVISFDFYHMDENPSIFETLPSHLEKADYILVPSRRIFANHMTQPEKYPLTTKYYQLLFSGRLGFEKVVEISSFLISDEKAEETFTVFDHPVIRIYKKTLPFYREQYKRMMEN